jgi:hypothetical protein
MKDQILMKTETFFVHMYILFIFLFLFVVTTVYDYTVGEWGGMLTIMDYIFINLDPIIWDDGG